ncbi:WXG100 family type VII secretion target [Actinoplanes sp. CA-054009]
MSANPLVSGPIEQPKSDWAGVWLAEDIELIARGVRDKSWVDGTLGAVGAGLDGLALVSDPVGALLQYGIAWLIEHVKPLSEALDWLAGNPGAIAGHAQTWRNVAESLRTESDELTRAVRFDLTEWQGAASDAYKKWAEQRDQSLQALAKASDTMALIAEGAGLLIATMRMMVRDAIATVVSRLIVYAGELIASLGTATPLVVEQVTTLCAAWAAKIARWLKDLISSLRNLGTMMRRLGEIVQDLIARLRGSHGLERGLFREGDGIARNGRKILMSRDNVLALAEKYGIDMTDVTFGIDKFRRGGGPGKEFYGVTMPDGEIKLARDAFMDEEQLARTLAHERFHLDELRGGLPFPWTEEARQAYEGRAYAHEEQWWQDHKHLFEGE